MVKGHELTKFHKVLSCFSHFIIFGFLVPWSISGSPRSLGAVCQLDLDHATLRHGSE